MSTGSQWRHVLDAGVCLLDGSGTSFSEVGIQHLGLACLARPGREGLLVLK